MRADNRLGVLVRFVVCGVILSLAWGCRDTSARPEKILARVEPPPVSPIPTPSLPPTCQQRLNQLEPVEMHPTLVAYYSGLPMLLASSNISPVLYLAFPKPPIERTLCPEAKAFLKALQLSSRPSKVIRAFVKRHAANRKLLRGVFLSEGYLFEERPLRARALVSELTLADLFDEPLLYLYRGKIHSLVRQGDHYIDEQGERAKLLLNDRVSTDKKELIEPFHLDLLEVRRLTGALRTVLNTMGANGAWLDLVFPDATVRPALVELIDGQTVVSCISDEKGDLDRSQEHAKRFWQWHRRVFKAAQQMVTERPGFDEPKDEAEDVQEDGELRLAWARAYWLRQSNFLFRETEYPVFDYRGNPVPPQVCIDFYFDTLERAAGTWYKRRRAGRGRTVGTLDFTQFKDLHRRQINSVLAFARTPDSPLERYDIPRRDWVPFRRYEPFARAVSRHAMMFREGDALIIHGLREEDQEEHYHAVLVLRTDPLTGMPMLIGDNAHRPALRSLAQAMRSAPRRSIKHRVRLNPEKYRQAVRRLNETDTDG